jgi:hypothetical protein
MVLQHGFTVYKQSSNQGAFAIIYRTAGNKAQCVTGVLKIGSVHQK